MDIQEDIFWSIIFTLVFFQFSLKKFIETNRYNSLNHAY